MGRNPNKELRMKYGHCAGTRRQRPQYSSWYAAIEAETLAQLEAAEAANAAAAPEQETTPSQEEMN
jgi:hypothetical protein